MSVEDKINMVERIDRLPFTRYMLLLAMVAAFGFFFDIFDLTTSAVTIPAVRVEMSLSAFQVTVALAAVFFGMFIGSIVSGYLADKIGRRKIFMVTLAIIAVGSILNAFSTNFLEFAAFRLITGFGIGGDLPVIWTIIAELFPSRLRGRLMGFEGVIGQAATPVITFISLYLLSASLTNWRLIFLIGAAIALILIPLRSIFPESPRYYLAHGEYEKAEQSLSAIESRVEREYGKPLPVPKQSKVRIISQEKTPFRDIFGRDLLGRTILAVIAFVFGVIGSYVFAAFLPLILIAKGFTITKSLEYAVIGYAGGILGSAFEAYIGEKVQRRTLIVIYNLICAATAIIFAFSFNVLLIVASAFIFYFFDQASGFTQIIYIPEVFPNKVRATASGFINSTGRLFVGITFVLLGALIGAIGGSAQLILVAIAWIISAGAFYAIRIKTNQRPVEDLTEKTQPAGLQI